MADDDASFALEAIAEDGKLITITPPSTGGVYNPATSSTEGAVVGVAFDRAAIVKDFDSRVSSAVNLQLRVGDKEIILAAQGIDKPTIGFTFTVDDEVFNVVPEKEGGLEVQTIYSGNTPVLYKVHGRHS